MVLGLNSVKTLALGFSLIGNLKCAGDKDFDHVGYWRRSLYSATGSACAEPARRESLIRKRPSSGACSKTWAWSR